jgi:CHAT domain-containing protein
MARFRYALLGLCASIGIVTSAGGAKPSIDEVAPRDVQAFIDRGSYDEAEAAAREYAGQKRSTDGATSRAVLEASDLLVRALCLNGHCAAASTLELARRTLVARRTSPHTYSELSASLVNAGRAYSAAADHLSAIRSLEEAVSLVEASSAQSIELSHVLDELGRVLIGAGRYDRALQVFDHSLEIKATRLPNDDVSVGETLRDKAKALQWKGDYERARGLLERARVVLERVDGARPAYVETMIFLGEQSYFEGNLIDARETLRHAVDGAQATFRPAHPTVALALRNLAIATADSGDVLEARRLQVRALAIIEDEYGPRHPETARYVNDLANSNLLLDEYPTARKLFTRTRDIVERTAGPRSEQMATVVHNLALVDAALGDYNSARMLHEQAMAIWEHALSRNHPFVASALTELATVYRKQGIPSDAVPLLQRALAIREQHLGLEHRDVARTASDLSAALAEMGQLVRAEALGARALGIWSHLSAKDAPDFADVLTLNAALEEKRGNAGAARDYYARALEIRERVFGRAHPDFAAAESGLARSLYALGDGPAALEASSEAESNAREHLRMMLRYLPEREGLSYALSRPKALDVMLALSETSEDAVDVALNGVIQNRALVLDEMVRRKASEASGAATVPLRTRLADAQRRLTNLVVRGPDERAPAGYAALITQAREEKEAAERELAENSASFLAERRREQIDVNQVRASLPTKGALLSYVRYERRTPRSGSTRAYLVFLVRSDRPTIAIRLGDADSIESLVSRWRTAIVDDALRAGTPENPTGNSARAAGAALRRRVWDPVADSLSGVETVFIVPDGSLNLVPFVALPVDSKAYLIERAPVIHYLPTERDLVPAANDAGKFGHGLLAIGGAAFDDRAPFKSRDGQRVQPAGTASPVRPATYATRSTCGRLQTLTFSPLPGTLKEVREIAGQWTSQTQDAADSALVLVAAKASERAFKQQAPGRRVLHLATHGFFLSDTCAPGIPSSRSVGGLVSTGAAQSGTDEVGLKTAQNPLLFSGLGLAGANLRASARADEEDGILTAAEVAAMDLRGVEWAVLSACETGVGQIKSSEGVFGLRRAFQIAGAHSVIMSLWEVDDQSTRKWMKTLYAGRYQRHLTTAQAVHEASLTALRERRAVGLGTQPFYWAAFVGEGDWR